MKNKFIFRLVAVSAFVWFPFWIFIVLFVFEFLPQVWEELTDAYPLLWKALKRGEKV